MAGARESHNIIVWNATSDIGRQIRSKDCRGYSTEMRVKTGDPGLYTYPDIVVVCGERRFLDERHDTLLNPTVLIEVLSPSTEAYDRGLKFELYGALESLREYLLISSERVRVDHFSRQAPDRWLLTSADKPDETIRLESLDATLRLSDLYEKVEFTTAVPSIRPPGA